MKDPILDRIYKARAMLLKKHGGWEGFLKHIDEMEKARLLREKEKTAKKRARAKAKTRAR